jgi:hypothetical protein
MNDAELDARAKAYASAQRVSYTEALTAVCASFSSFREQPARIASHGEDRSDAEIDASAKAYARENRVSYTEALTAVCASFSSFRESAQPVSFSEAAQVVEGQWIDIFRAGEHTDDSGTARNFSLADIADMASGYNPALREAPLVLGHPETNGPAHGWIGGLRATPEGVLQMRAQQVERQFAEMLKAGRFKKRSASFYPPRAPGNPTPGKWYVRHVGFLGATPPAVAGLKDLAFS